MAKLSDWEGYAAAHDGTVVAWINQAVALKGTDSAGVCRAITRAWIDCCRGTKAAQIAFLKKFRVYGSDKQMVSHNVPDEFREKQDELSKQFDADGITFAKLMLAWTTAIADMSAKIGAAPDVYAAAENAQIEAKKKVSDFIETAQGGPACFDAVLFSKFDALLVEMTSTATYPCYYGLSITGPISQAYPKGFGRVMGFEFQPERHPASFQFLDANSGLFHFTAADKMIEFFRDEVWPKFYASLSVSALGWFCYDLGLRETMTAEERAAARTDYVAKLIPKMGERCVIC